MGTYWRDVHAACLRIDTFSPDGEAYSEYLLRRFPAAEPRRPDITLALHMVTELPPASASSAQATLVHSQGELCYLVNGERFYIAAGHRARFDTDCGNGTVSAYVTRALRSEPVLLADLLLNSLAPLLRRRGVFTIHACAAARAHRSVLLVGQGGSGKTTTGLALVRSGWRFIASDRSALQRSGSGISVLGHREPIRIRPATVAFFPELQGMLDAGNDSPQLTFEVEDVYGDVLAKQAQIGLLLFSRVCRARRSQVVPLSAGDALGELLLCSADAWDKPTLAANFRLLALLAEAVPAHRLDLGQDFAALPDLIASMMGEA